ncbi:hypothetical protein KY290_022029 [Solanum tuberosum]|uniref:Transposon MuDR mudrA n=1 Tax=Solanum tuberosum TaxID=4113 RepID=A0ABQ7V3A0_SOLTU|nr:hypothetical protein KY289_021183 [Solanum tuberosum]KAH0758536.1 hypothetical protein KY290_022029 [Solanum tuberosum]
MANIKMWPKSTRPSIEPPEITSMTGRPRKKRSKDSNEPSKKKFGKATRKGRTMKCSLCKNFGHNKKGCPIATSGSGGATTLATSTSVTTSATTSATCIGGTGGAATKRPATTLAALIGATAGATATATCTGRSGGAATKRPVTILAASRGATAGYCYNMYGVAQPTNQFSTEQSTIGASGSKRSSKVKRGSAKPGYKRPRTEKPRTVGFRVIFEANSSVIERSGTTDRVLRSAN